MKKLTILFALALILVAGTAQASWYLDFEWGLGHDYEVIASGIPGLQFTTTDGQDWMYGDITADHYNVTSDNGSTYGFGTYYMSGDVFAWLGTTQGSGRIDFTDQNGSWFTTGYCSYSTFYLEAYDASGTLIDQAVGAANTDVSMDYLTVSSATNNIAYVLMHDTGNYWCADNMSGDATGVTPPVPEPATLILLGSGLLGLGILRRKNR